MDLQRVGLYVVLAVAALVVVRIAVSMVLTVVGVLWTLVTLGVTLAVVLGVAYGVYRALGSVRDGGADERTKAVDADEVGAAGARSSDGVDRVTEQYVAGERSEAELEAELDDAFDAGRRDEIDRELDRSGSE